MKYRNETGEKLNYLKYDARRHQSEVSARIEFYRENEFYGAIASDLNELSFWQGYRRAISDMEHCLDIYKEETDDKKCETV